VWNGSLAVLGSRSLCTSVLLFPPPSATTTAAPGPERSRHLWQDAKSPTTARRLAPPRAQERDNGFQINSHNPITGLEGRSPDAVVCPRDLARNLTCIQRFQSYLGPRRHAREWPGAAAYRATTAMSLRHHATANLRESATLVPTMRGCCPPSTTRRGPLFV
jgi:hypothetical protein